MALTSGPVEPLQTLCQQSSIHLLGSIHRHLFVAHWICQAPAWLQALDLSWVSNTAHFLRYFRLYSNVTFLEWSSLPPCTTAATQNPPLHRPFIFLQSTYDCWGNCVFIVFFLFLCCLCIPSKYKHHRGRNLFFIQCLGLSLTHHRYSTNVKYFI